ncbi:GDSL-type esterase/lipase family protein [Aureibaculum luteum]|uniref:GDSL-type esterase/lipase family protein n=1 Tax=Aureibaculum luteum TaxID=1548456 RepID=UPI000E4AB586|nr:GDSL-type esterase/lipase family protein [Aureibaculum luteum]
MKRTSKLLILFLLTFSVGLIAQEPIKIACVGNSITYGAGVVNREKNSYPAQLQELLGDKYEVKNFGVSGRTLLNKGNHPYTETKAYKEALNFIPDIVFMKLGTNDSKLGNRVYLGEFEKDYQDLIQSFKNINDKIRIVLLLPVPSFTVDTTKIWNPVIKNKIIPLTQSVAFNTNVEVIDLYHLFVDKKDLLPDGIHPSGLGQTIIAKRLYEVIHQEQMMSINFFEDKNSAIEKSENFYGYSLLNFKIDSTQCKIVVPKKVAKGNPWVLRARFWGHEPQTDIALLERGFHIAYCDVSSLYGSKLALKRWNNFYKLMTSSGLSKKVVLEGMSRGGLIIYNWAAKNPKKIAAIYADAPVLDGKSWPGGMGQGKLSKGDWGRFKKVYKLKNERKLERFKDNPIHKVKKIVKGGYPMLHVVGDADNVVPISENTTLFEKKINQFSGDIEVIHKPNTGHHPHSLQNPTPIVDFILRATDQKVSFVTIPSPSAEYRSAAGWTNGTDWWAQAHDIDSVVQTLKNIDVLVIGNSITQSWGSSGNRNYINSNTGTEAAKTYFKDITWMNAGISGDRTQHVLWRIEKGNYENANPKMVVVTIGVNNFRDNNAFEIFEGIEKLIALTRTKFKKSKIVVLGPLPTGIDPTQKTRQKYNSVHKLLSAFKTPNKVKYYNLISLFIDEKGFLNEDYFSGDGIHLKPEGYAIWGKFIKEKYEQLLEEN